MKKKMKIALNRISQDQIVLSENLDIRYLGDSPSIYDDSSYPSRRVQGAFIEVIGSEDEISSYLKSYKKEGFHVYSSEEV